MKIKISRHIEINVGYTPRLELKKKGWYDIAGKRLFLAKKERKVMEFMKYKNQCKVINRLAGIGLALKRQKQRGGESRRSCKHQNSPTRAGVSLLPPKDIYLPLVFPLKNTHKYIYIYETTLLTE